MFLPYPRGAQQLLRFGVWLKGTSTAAPARQRAFMGLAFM